MKPFKQSVAAGLLAAIFLSLPACTGEAREPLPVNSTQPSDTTFDGDDQPLDLPENLNFNGRKIRILTETGNDYFAINEEGQEYENIYAGELTVADLNKEAVNDAVYNREIYVEDLLGVEIERIQTPAFQTARQFVETMITSGDDDCDIVAAPAAATMWSAQFGYYTDLGTVSVLSLESPWWSQDFNAESSFGGRMYFATGDLSLTLLKYLHVIFYNKNLAADNKIEDVYQTVFDGEWTIDRLIALSSNVYIDMNGNSEADDGDVYGYMGACLSSDSLWSAFDIDILSKDEDDYLTYTAQTEKFGIAYEKYFRLFNAKTTYHGDWWRDDVVHEYFVKDQALFASSELQRAESDSMRDMQSDYGILPVPKFDAAQTGYYTMPHDQYTVFGLPASLTDTTAAGAVLEAMAWYSYRYVTPAYLNVTMKGQYANDPETRQMLDLIIAGFRVDAAWIYATYLNDYPQLWRHLLGDQNSSYSSTLATKERKIKALLTTLNEAYQKLAE